NSKNAGEPKRKLGSTAIRELVRAGAVERAADLLGRHYAVAGTVEHGAARGRKLGFPTANVASAGLLPLPGVYACYLLRLDRGGHHELRCWPAVANLGTNPTFSAGTAGTPAGTTLEVHALDVDLGDALYGQEVEVAFVARLRDEATFPGVDALRQAIADDIARARPLLDHAGERLHVRPLTAGSPGSPESPGGAASPATAS
ncbi:MAG: hypothetical protein KC457_16620, partial [Myxococcales bacterium]|nr:hypothetical protein [Myxococcales bacterium]